MQEASKLDYAISVLSIIFQQNNFCTEVGCESLLSSCNESDICEAGAVAASHLKVLLRLERVGKRDLIMRYYFQLNKMEREVLKLIFDMYKKDLVN